MMFFSFPSPSFKPALASLVFHVLIGVLIVKADSRRLNRGGFQNQTAVKVNIVPKEPKIEEKEKPPEPPPPPPPKKIKPKKPLTPKPTFIKKDPEKKPREPPKPSYGLSPDSFAPDGKSTVTAPMGNTLGIDPSIRSDKVEPLTSAEMDLSRDARLIKSSVTEPEYTPEAEDAGLEGIWAVEVFVNEKGVVEEVQLNKMVGFGMDERLKNAAKSARFEPRRDKLGRAVPGWTEIKFRLILP